MGETLLRFLGLMVIGYVGVCSMIYLVQERLIFFPERDPPGTRYEFGLPVEEVWIPVDGAVLHALWFRQASAQGVILYFHGNGGTLRSWGEVAHDLVPYGYDLVIVDIVGMVRVPALSPAKCNYTLMRRLRITGYCLATLKSKSCSTDGR